MVIDPYYCSGSVKVHLRKVFRSEERFGRVIKVDRFGN